MAEGAGAPRDRFMRGPWLIPVVYACVMSAIALFVHRLPLFGPETDFLLYYEADAARVLGGGLPTDPYRGPAYSVLIAAVMAVTRLPGFEAGVLLSVVSSTLALVLAVGLARRLEGDRVAVWTGFFMVTAWAFARYGYAASSDAFFLLLTMGIVYAAQTERLGAARCFAIGVGCGVAMLTRFNAFFLVPGVLAGVAWRFRAEPWRALTRQWLVRAVPLVAGTVLALVPWGIHTARVYGRPFHNRNHENLAFALHGGGEANWDAFWYSAPDAPGPHVHMYTSMWDVIAYDPFAVATTWLSGLVVHPALDAWEMLGPPVALTVLVGFARPGAFRALNLAPFAWAPVSLFFWLSMAIAFYSPRLSLPLLPFYAFLLAQLALPAWDDARARWRRGAWVMRGHAFVCLAAVLILNGIELAKTPWSLHRLAQRAIAAGVIRGEDAVVMERKPHFAYFIEGEHLFMPIIDDEARFLEAVCASNATHVLFTDWERRTRPALVGVATSEAGRDVLEVVARGRDDERDVLLRIRRASCPIGATGASPDVRSSNR